MSKLKIGEKGTLTFQVADITEFKRKIAGFARVYTTDADVVIGNFQPQLGGCYLAEVVKESTDYGIQHKIIGKVVAAKQLEPAALGKFLSLNLKGKGVMGDAVIASLVSACEQDGLNLQELLDNNERDTLVECVGTRNQKKVDALLEAWPKLKPKADLMSPLLGYGLSEAMAEAAVALWGNRAVEVVEKSPYELILSIDGVGFLVADRIAKKVGTIRLEDPLRLSAAFATGMRDATVSGHIGVPRKLLIERTMLLVNECETDSRNRRVLKAGVAPLISAKMLEDQLNVMLSEDSSEEEATEFAKSLVEAPDDAGNSIIWYKPLLDAEKEIAERIASFNPVPRFDLSETVDEVASGFGLPPSVEQRQAVSQAFEFPFSIITGGPGTGKSFTLKLLTTILRKAGIRYHQCAPTGRAAKRITEATGDVAKTLHTLIGFTGSFKNCNFNRACPLEIECLIIDEGSMCDTESFAALLNACPDNCRIIVVGDVDQLPSVGPGQVLRDLIRSGVVPVTRLSRGYRFAGGIAEAAERINRGQIPETTEDGQFVFVETETPAQDMIDTFKQLIRSGVNADDIQVLSPVHKGAAGNTELNKAIQRLVNPEKSTDELRLKRDSGDIRVGDRIMQNKNEKQLGLVNGDIGWIDDLPSTKDGKVFLTLTDSRTLELEVKSTLNMRLAYSITVHKSQGAEAPVVLMVLDRASMFVLRRSTVYTGVTRGKQKVYLFSPRDVLSSAVRKGEPPEGSRRTSLVSKLLMYKAAAAGTLPTTTDPLAAAMDGGASLAGLDI